MPLPSLIGRDGSALDANVVLLDGLGGVDGHLIVGLIAVRQAQVVVLDVDVQIWKDQLKRSGSFSDRFFFKQTLFLISAQMIRVISSPERLASTMLLNEMNTIKVHHRICDVNLLAPGRCSASNETMCLLAIYSVDEGLVVEGLDKSAVHVESCK